MSPELWLTLAFIVGLIWALRTVPVIWLTGKLPAPWRIAARVFWIVLLLAGGAAGVLAARHILRANPDVNPYTIAGARLLGIESFAQAYCASSLFWLPPVFRRLENLGAAVLVAVRQLRARASGFLTAISFLAFLGVGLASFGLCFATSIMGGFGNDLKLKMLGNNAHVVVDRERGGFDNWRPILAAISRLPGVTSATALVQGEVMVTSQTNLSGVLLRGIDPSRAGSTQNIRRELIRGRLSYLLHPEQLLTLNAYERRPITSNEADSEPSGAQTSGDDRNSHEAPPPSAPPDEMPPGAQPFGLPGSSIATDVLPGVIVGRELATNLHLAVGDEVRVVSPFGGMVTPAGPLPKTRLFRIAGIFYSGMYEYDTKYAYVTIPAAQNFFNYENDEITSIEVRVADVDNADRVAAAIRPIVQSRGLRVRDWKQLNKNLFRALRLEKLMMFILLGVAIMVASFAIVATLLLLAFEKGREIAVLKAMGASDGFIARVFVSVGLLIGVVGSALGVSAAFLVCRLIQRLGIPIDPEVYYIRQVPVFISFSDYAMVMGIAIGIALIATLYPAWAAARLRPVEAMRFG